VTLSSTVKHHFGLEPSDSLLFQLPEFSPGLKLSSTFIHESQVQAHEALSISNRRCSALQPPFAGLVTPLPHGWIWLCLECFDNPAEEETEGPTKLPQDFS